MITKPKPVYTKALPLLTLTCKMKIKESAKFNSCIFFYGLQYYNSITFTEESCYDYILGDANWVVLHYDTKPFSTINDWKIYLQF